MSSSNNRLKLVQMAVAQAGRGAEIYSHAKDLLNVMLRSWAFEKKYPNLRKVGDAITLSTGSSTAALPSDFGYGMDNLLFGTDQISLDEKDFDEFIKLGGIPTASQNNARPSYYTVDKNAGLFRFNQKADKDYTFIPIYFHIPADIALNSDGDASTVWFDDDDTIIQGLVEYIYQFADDPREFTQHQKQDKKKAEFRRGTTPINGGSTGIRLASSWFRQRRP